MESFFCLKLYTFYSPLSNNNITDYPNHNIARSFTYVNMHASRSNIHFSSNLPQITAFCKNCCWNVLTAEQWFMVNTALLSI